MLVHPAKCHRSANPCLIWKMHNQMLHYIKEPQWEHFLQLAQKNWNLLLKFTHSLSINFFGTYLSIKKHSSDISFHSFSGMKPLSATGSRRSRIMCKSWLFIPINFCLSNFTDLLKLAAKRSGNFSCLNHLKITIYHPY